jgi:hypothetical protein
MLFIFSLIFCSSIAIGLGYVLRQDGYEGLSNLCFAGSIVFSIYMLSLVF